MSASVLENYHSKPFTGSSHLWAMKLLSNLPSSARVLDIGCGNAVLGQFLKERGLSELYAVEPDEEARARASLIYKSTAASLADFCGKLFDAVLLMDVIEHVPNHPAMLEQACSLLAPGGKLLISVPNVAHWSVRFALLCGFFEYTNRGILDRTHINFFTRRSFKRLLESRKDLQLETLEASIEPVEFVLPRFVWDNTVFNALSRLRLRLAGFCPGLLAYQHLALLELKSPQ